MMTLGVPKSKQRLLEPSYCLLRVRRGGKNVRWVQRKQLKGQVSGLSAFEIQFESFLKLRGGKKDVWEKLRATRGVERGEIATTKYNKPTKKAKIAIFLRRIHTSSHECRRIWRKGLSGKYQDVLPK